MPMLEALAPNLVKCRGRYGICMDDGSGGDYQWPSACHFASSQPALKLVFQAAPVGRISMNLTEH